MILGDIYCLPVQKKLQFLKTFTDEAKYDLAKSINTNTRKNSQNTCLPLSLGNGTTSDVCRTLTILKYQLQPFAYFLDSNSPANQLIGVLGARLGLHLYGGIKISSQTLLEKQCHTQMALVVLINKNYYILLRHFL